MNVPGVLIYIVSGWYLAWELKKPRLKKTKQYTIERTRIINLGVTMNKQETYADYERSFEEFSFNEICYLWYLEHKGFSIYKMSPIVNRHPSILRNLLCDPNQPTQEEIDELNSQVWDASEEEPRDEEDEWADFDSAI